MSKPQKALKLFVGVRIRPGRNSNHIIQIHAACSTPLCNPAFLCFDVKWALRWRTDWTWWTCSSRDLEKIKISSKKTKNKAIKYVPKDITHQSLEGCGSICKPKRHYQVFVVACGCVEGSFPFVPLPDADQMIGVAKIKLGEDGGTLEQIKGGGDVRQRVAILIVMSLRPL